MSRRSSIRLLGSVMVLLWSLQQGAPVTSAQAVLEGTWRVERPGAMWTAVLRLDGARVIGAVSSCASNGAVEISEGSVDRDTATFKCTSGDGDRTLAFTARIEGDVLVLSWTKEIRDGGFPREGDRIFGVSAPETFTARRVAPATDFLAHLAARAWDRHGGPWTRRRARRAGRRWPRTQPPDDGHSGTAAAGTLLELVQRWVERPAAHVQDVGGLGAQTLRDRQAVERLERHELQDQGIERRVENHDGVVFLIASSGSATSS